MIPKDVWGAFSAGEWRGYKIIIHAGERGGWDLCIFPPYPSKDIWFSWAMDENDLEAWFSEDFIELPDHPWVWPGTYAGVVWGDDGISSAEIARRQQPKWRGHLDALMNHLKKQEPSP